MYLKEVDTDLEVHIHAGARPYLFVVIYVVWESKEQVKLCCIFKDAH